MNERELFEEWFKRELNKHANFSTHMGVYLDVGVSAAWKAWQASAQREGYKLVPLEPTDKMEDAYWDAYIDVNEVLMPSTIYKAMIGAVNDH